MRVVANNFSAVDGRNSGAQIQVITKGGTNDFRGSASHYFQNDALSARNVFETAVPDFKKNQFGYTFGGPIVRSRLFFFTSYEGLRQDGRARFVLHGRDPGVPQLRHSRRVPTASPPSC